MKEAFFECIGSEDSLKGYQKSNRLVLLKILFSLIDNYGAALVSDVIKSYKHFYETRKQLGLITDVGADPIIIDIENASDVDILTVIKRHPFRVLNEKGYLNIFSFGKCDYFTFNDKLMEELSHNDIQGLAHIIDRKLSLYFSKIDNNSGTIFDQEGPRQVANRQLSLVNSNYYLAKPNNRCNEKKDCATKRTINDFYKNRLISTRAINRLESYKIKAKAKVEAKARLCHANSVDLNSIKKEPENNILSVDSVAISNKSNVNQLVAIYNMFESQYQKGIKFISLDDPGLELTQSDLMLITANEGLFYLCSAKRALLTIWIVQAIDRLFNTKKKVLRFNEIYEFLRQQFIPSFNRKNLIKLLNCEDLITISQFAEIKGYVNAAVNVLFTSDLDRTPYEEESGIKELGQISISSTLRARIEFSLGIDKHDKGVDIELSAAEYGNLQLYDNAIIEAGIEICRWGYQSPVEAFALTEALSDFSRVVKKERQQIEVLMEHINNIASKNKSAKIEPLIKAYSKDADIQNAIYNHISGCKYVSDLHKVTKLMAKNDSSITKLIDFLAWLKNDIRKPLKEAMDNMYKNERSLQVVQTRARGATLEETGVEFGITRERIRQIEAKVEKSFSSFYSRYRPIYILAAFSKSDIGFDENDIYDIFEYNEEIFRYFTKKKAYNDLTWADELSIFLTGDASWYEDVKEEIVNLPEQISSSVIMDIVIAVKGKLHLLSDDETIRKIIIFFYSKVGDYFTKVKMTKRDMYKVVIERYYPEGMKLFDDFEMMRFKTHLGDMFGIANTDDTRAISSRITDFTILCDRGKYISPSAIRITSQLLDDMHQFVTNHVRSSILFAEIFERFKFRLLEESNIKNRYFLQGTLKYYWDEEFSFTKDTINRNRGEEGNIRAHIVNFVKASHGTVTPKDIKHEFLGVTDVVVNLALADNGDILQWGFGEYIHASLINIDDEDAEKMKQALDAEIMDGTVSTSALYAHIFEREPSLLNDNKIYNYTALFSVYRYLFPNEYTFSRPYISSGDTAMTADAVIEEYIASFDELAIADLKFFAEEKHINIFNFSSMIEKNCSDFVRVDEDMLIRTSCLTITENVINDVQNSLIASLGDKGYISAKDYEDFFFFPYLGVKWTSHLLVAVIKKYFDKLSVSRYTVDHRYLTDIIYKNELGINDHEELIIYAIRLENNKAKFENATDIESFLKTEGLIAATGSIPQSLYERGIVEITEFGQLKIN